MRKEKKELVSNIHRQLVSQTSNDSNSMWTGNNFINFLVECELVSITDYRLQSRYWITGNCGEVFNLVIWTIR